jgi:hypothetical protein
VTTDKEQTRTRSRDGRFAIGDRVAARKLFAWMPTRRGKVWKFSPEGGLAFVEWDDKLGPQVVATGDLARAGAEEEGGQ